MSVAGLSDWPWRHWRRETPVATALVADDRAFTWEALCAAIDARAAAFQRHGIGPGCGVALCGRNSAELVLAYLAALQLGARALPLNPQIPLAQLERILPELDVGLGWSEAEHPWPAAVRPVAVPALAPAGSSSAAVEWQAERPATLTLTSGSSGSPKGVVHAATHHLASAQGLLAAMSFEAPDRWLLSLPLFHVSGQAIVWRCLLRGASMAVSAGADPAQALTGCTHASLVPTQLLRLLGQGVQLPALKQVLLGGAAIPLELTKRAERAGIECWCGYGMTEMAATVTAKRADDTPSVGRTLPLRELKIVDGEIWVRGASLALGYWQAGQIRPLTNDAGWFATRDRGAMEQGELRILGRLDNIFISGGENIQPEAIEAVLAACPDVLQVFVVPIPDVEFGQRPLAVLEMRNGREADVAALQAALAGRIARYQWPVDYFVLPSALIGGGGIKVSRLGVSAWASAEFLRRHPSR